MIQRIQSVYLLLVVIACVAYIFVPFGLVKNPDSTLETWAIKQVVPVMIASIVIAIIASLYFPLTTEKPDESRAGEYRTFRDAYRIIPV